jgi:transcriptional regulator GlxA family with amidase domain
MELARDKLCSTELQIQLIAEQAGYLNASDFSRAFRQRYGLGPREYRQVSRGILQMGTGND